MTVSPSSVAPPVGAVVFVPALGRSLPLLLDVPEAGALAGLSRYASYRAAQDGGLPVLRVGQRLRVPTGSWLDLLGLSYEAQQ